MLIQLKYLFLICIFSNVILCRIAYSNESMRHCMLLPIIENPNQKIGFKVFEDVETYLKDSHWCTYKSNSELIDILSQYSKNFESHLDNKDVLKVVSDKTKSGTMIRISINDLIQYVDVELKILGDNGEDLYFSEKIQLKNRDEALVSRTIINWLEVFEKTIPYDGRVKGILGEQFTIDIGRKSSVFNGSEVVIERPIGKRKHPLLKEITDFETEKIGMGKIFEVSDTQAQGKITNYEPNKKLKLNDWIILKSDQKRKVIEQGSMDEKNEDDESQEIGKLGTLNLYFNFTSSGFDLSGNSTRGSKASLFGAEFEGELWATRNYWAGLDFGQRMGTYSKDNGTFTNTENKTTNNFMRLKFAYRYLPLGFFYGPQIDFYGGYGKNTYGLQTQTSDGLTAFTFSGILLGLRGSIPIDQLVRMYAYFDFHLTSSFGEKTRVHGSDQSSSHYRIGLSGTYQFVPNIQFIGGIETISSKAEFSGATKELSFSDVVFKMGCQFAF